MDWVEVAGRTVDEAKEMALGQLGVAEADAEIVILSEPKVGLFGRTRGEARVRARVAPVGPRPKRTRSGRSRDAASGRRSETRRSSAKEPSAKEAAKEAAPRANGTAGRSRSRRKPSREGGEGAATGRAAARAESAQSQESAGGQPSTKEETEMGEVMSLEEQAEAARAFLSGLLDCYGLAADVQTRILDEDTAEIAAVGDGLGMLVGPRGTTLAALQDLTRTVVQRQNAAKADRILVDVADYRRRRAEALARFSTQVAEEVKASGAEKALEPMSPADRKVVHDTVNAIAGVATRSEGMDADRHIVIFPSE